MMRVGVEVGGTFTDLVLVDGAGVRVEKVPSTPHQPDLGAMQALAAAEVDFGRLEDLVHGSTVATNAVLERKGAKVCLVVSRGTRDVLFLQRHTRRYIYDLFYRKPQPVLRRRDVVEVAERLTADGSVVEALDEAEAEALLREKLAGGYAAVAICLLNSYVNPRHEERLAALVRQIDPSLSVTCSAHVCREFREYERCSTAALAAYVQPVVASYLGRFSASLEAAGYQGRFSIMQSNGGRLPAAAIGQNAITCLYSGPAAGVIGAARQAAKSDFEKVITLDMGGTSTDVSLVEGGVPELAGMTEIDGLPIKTPVIDIATVGAGGGSLVWLDDGAMLRVGPQSAGADPGPASYGRGGSQPTITDAHLVRGTIRAASFLEGRMALDEAAARAALEPLAEAFGMALEEAADSAVQIAEANIVRAVQRVSTERGKDPRDYALVAFGGAGPMIGARVAEELGMRAVVVPPHAGVLSAWGLLTSDYGHYESRTHRVLLDGAATGTDSAMAECRRILAELQAAAAGYLAEHGVAGSPAYAASLDMRYVGQAFEISVPVDLEAIADMPQAELQAAFEECHRQVFEFDKGHGGLCEIITLRVGVAVPPAALPQAAPPGGSGRPAESVRLFERGVWLDCPCRQRHDVDQAQGPALIEDGTSTIFLPPGWIAASDAAGNLVLEQRESP